ncbi:MAG: hypothetical protein ACI9MR_001584 [Myxococcota bacterium]|jgi:hypothetical protein
MVTADDNEDYEIDFSMVLMSFASNVSLHLDPDSKAYDLKLAKQTIDMLEVLQKKTDGNLTEEEEALFSGLLYQTRLAYCDAKKQ